MGPPPIGFVKTLLRFVLIAAAGWFVYSPVLHGRWLWDDDRYITENAALHEPGGLAKIWLAPADVNYFPVTSTAQWLQWRAWGDDPFGYHVTNLVLHGLSGLLLWRLLRQLGASHAWLGGLLWIVHPLAVESVAWISELKNTLSLPFLLLAMLAYIAADEGRAGRPRPPLPPRPRPAARSDRPAAKARTNGHLLLSLLFFTFAMLSKGTVAMFPVIILLFCWWRRGKITAADVRSSAPYFIISLALGVVTLVFEHGAIGRGGAVIGGLLSRLACAGLAAVFYLWKSVLPFGLLPIYPRWNVDPPAAWQALPWLALGGLLWLLWRRRATWGRHALLGLGCFLLNLVPVLGFLPMAYQRLSWVADHFAYAALPGLVGLAAAGLGALPSRMLSGKAWPMLAGALILGAGLAGESRRYTRIFRDEETLWSYDLQHNPDAWMAHNNLGVERMKEGNAPAAIAQFTEALRLDPASPEAHSNLGVALANLGRLPEAIVEGEAAVHLAPDYAPGREKLGEIRIRAGRQAVVWFNEGNALVQNGRAEEAMADYERALNLKPDFPEAQANLGNILLSRHRLPEAVEHYQAALRLKPDYADAHSNLGLALRALGREQEAAGEIETARRLGAAH